jgi:RNA polymerase subunit RPABC4/transcription elongation factor Spt4
MRGGGGGGGLAIATSNAMVCPTCRTEYHGMTYCTRDARRLVPPEEMLGGPGIGPARSVARSAGLVCMACQRAYEPGLRSCPHDGNELVPFPVYNATRPRKRGSTEPAGVIARICPVCGSKYDLNARFCGHDAGELVVIN